MKVLVILSTLFVIGSLLGYILEVSYRSITNKRFVNPGFMVGPYLPIYGVGVLLLYLISNIDLNINILFLEIIIKILIIGVSMTLVEFIAGLIFIKLLKVKLWDYSARKGNILGIICPLFSLIWLVIGSIYYFFINPFLVDAIHFISGNLIYSYFIGLIIGMMIVDFSYSIKLLTTLKHFKEYEHLRFFELKEKVKKMMKNIHLSHKEK